MVTYVQNVFVISDSNILNIDKRIDVSNIKKIYLPKIFILDFANRKVINLSDSNYIDIYHNLKKIYDYYGITTDVILEKHNMSDVIKKMDNRHTFMSFMTKYYIDYMFDEMINIIDSTKPQLIYLEKDFYKIRNILDNQIRIYDRYSLPKLEDLIFFDKRKKTNLNDIKLLLCQ